MTQIPSPGRNSTVVRVGDADLVCILDALEGTRHLDNNDLESDHRARLIVRLREKYALAFGEFGCENIS